MKTIFTDKSTYGLRLALVGIAAAFFMIFDYLPNTPDLRAYCAPILHRIEQVINFPLARVAKLRTYLHTQSQMALVQEKLRQENALLHAQLQNYAYVMQENQRLQSLFATATKNKQAFLLASIMYIDPDPFTHQFVIDKGSVEGVQEKQAVIDESGIVGCTIAVQKHSARMLLITDHNSAIPVLNVRTGMRAILAGTGSKELQLQHTPNTADIRAGDLLVTSGIGGVYPPGFPVGTVQAIKRDAAAPFSLVKVRPAANLMHGRQVLLIKEKAK